MVVGLVVGLVVGPPAAEAAAWWVVERTKRWWARWWVELLRERCSSTLVALSSALYRVMRQRSAKHKHLLRRVSRNRYFRNGQTAVNGHAVIFGGISQKLKFRWRRDEERVGVGAVVTGVPR